LEYDDERDERIAVEVKGTTAQQFGNVELTAGEWRAAMRLGERYWLYLVADCCSTQPLIQRIQDPAQLVKMGQAEITSSTASPALRTACNAPSSLSALDSRSTRRFGLALGPAATPIASGCISRPPK
jgi:hypothetical protein